MSVRHAGTSVSWGHRDVTKPVTVVIPGLLRGLFQFCLEASGGGGVDGVEAGAEEGRVL